jgi:hypothetical protein
MPDEELYDLTADPHEINNLVDSKRAEDQTALNRLRAELTRWLERTGDQGQVFEPPDVAAAAGKTKK